MADKRKIDKSKFNFVQLNEEVFDQKFETVSYSYFQDALRRFRKDKSSVIAFFVLAFIILMVIFAPGFNSYEYDQKHDSAGYLPPRIPVLEDIGIADGTVVIGDMDDYNQGVLMTEFEVAYGETYDPNLEYPEEVLEVDGTYYVFGKRQDDEGNFKIDYPVGSIEKILKVHTHTQQGITQVTAVVVINKYYAAGEEYHDTYFWFGTDSLGRDIWTRLWQGGRVSLTLAFSVSITNIVIGTIIGSIGGYYGGATDLIIQRIKEILSGVPWLVVLILMLMYFGKGLGTFIVAFAITGWMGTSGVVRAQFYRYKYREYVLAARTLGIPDRKLMFRHILPNAIGPIITASILMIPGAIFGESAMAYLGLGLSAPNPSVGTLLAEGQGLLETQPYLIFFPAILISLLMISFNMFGNGLRDAFNPSLRGSE